MVVEFPWNRNANNHSQQHFATTLKMQKMEVFRRGKSFVKKWTIELNHLRCDCVGATQRILFYLLEPDHWKGDLHKSASRAKENFISSKSTIMMNSLQNRGKTRFTSIKSANTKYKCRRSHHWAAWIDEMSECFDRMNNVVETTRNARLTVVLAKRHRLWLNSGWCAMPHMKSSSNFPKHCDFNALPNEKCMAQKIDIRPDFSNSMHTISFWIFHWDSSLFSLPFVSCIAVRSYTLALGFDNKKRRFHFYRVYIFIPHCVNVTE